MKKPLVHVLIINWNGLEHLKECFDSLLLCTYENVEFVLVDNASDDGSVDYVEDKYGNDPRVEVLQCASNLGWSGGNNVGIRRALEQEADYIFLLNNDTWIAPDAIAKLVDKAESNRAIGALAPKMLMYDNPALLNSLGVECSIIGNAWDLGIGRLDADLWSESRKVLGVCGGAAFLRSSVLLETGLLPDEFGIYLDDLDLCMRIWNAGFEIWNLPEAEVRHKFGATMGHGARARRKYYLNTRNRFWLVLRNYPLGELPSILPAVFIGECKSVGRATLDGELWRLFAHVKAWVSALSKVPGAVWARCSGKTATCRFWDLLHKKRLFFEGTRFPDQGWYGEETVNGKTIRPLSAAATYEVKSGKIRIISVNPFPGLGRTDIRVCQTGGELHRLETADFDRVELDVQPGNLELRAEKIFKAEDTGEQVDIGGWIAIEELDEDNCK